MGCASVKTVLRLSLLRLLLPHLYPIIVTSYADSMLLISGSEWPSSERGGSRQAYYCIADANLPGPKNTEVPPGCCEGDWRSGPCSAATGGRGGAILCNSRGNWGSGAGGQGSASPVTVPEWAVGAWWGPTHGAEGWSWGDAVPTDGVGATWSVVEKALNKVRGLYKSSRAA